MQDKEVNALVKALKNKKKLIALVAPSFVAEFSYPGVISQLKEIGFDKVAELTFGAKMVNREYHEQLKNNKILLITSVCPGVVETIKNKHPKFVKSLAKIDSPMIATAKICKKFYPKHKTCFISPCFFKKVEAQNSKYVDYVITYQELHVLLNTPVKRIKDHNLQHPSKNLKLAPLAFDRFYNDYTKVYPLSGGLSKTSHLREIIKPGEEKIIDGISDVEKFLKKYKNNAKIKFLDVTFCKGGCIGGPCVASQLSLKQKKKKVLDYMNTAKHEEIPEDRKGLIKKAKGIKFSW